MRFSHLLYFILVSCQAAVIKHRQAGPTVTIANGTIVGFTSNNIDSFKGIPYAQPPVGDRRLRPPAVLSASFGTINATADGPPCPPNTASSNTALGPEDCLYLNVQRPAGIQAGRKVPVVAYMYAGSFTGGSTISYDATQFIGQANGSLGEPFIFVIFNYRLSGWGFLSGAELSTEGSTNLGLRDQRLALQWIQDNIGAFGGDPTKVTIWGESAGSFSVLDHLIINNGNSQYKNGRLFRAAIMSSGTSLPTFPVRHPRPQATFNKVVAAAGCSGAANTLQCLRSVSASTFSNAVLRSGDSPDKCVFPYPPRPDPASTFFPTSPEKAIAAGAFRKVPIIVGDQEDEGTLFVDRFQNYANSTDGIVKLITGQMPELSLADATDFVNTYPGTYPDSVIAGSPFRTGLSNEIFAGYKRISAVNGDFVFTLSRRITLDAIASLTPTWSSLACYLYGTSDRGTQHATDTKVLLYGSPSVPVFYRKQVRYVSFFSYADPNYLGTKGNAVVTGDPNYSQWPTYNTSSRLLANFSNTPYPVALLPDDFRQSSYLQMKRNISRFSS